MKEHIKPCVCKICVQAIDQRVGKALQSQTQDIIKKIEGMKVSSGTIQGVDSESGKWEEHKLQDHGDLIYNKALDDVLKELDK